MTATEIRSQLSHPVIDGDGHWLEPIPIFLEYLSEVGGPAAVDNIREVWRQSNEWYRAGWDERQRRRLRRTIWWGVTSNTYDKATALLPALLNERLPELGIDFAVIYPSFGLTINGLISPDLGRDAARAYNLMTMDMFKPHLGRFAPVAILPAHTPQDAIEELEYVTGTLGYKAIMLRGNQERPIQALADEVGDSKAAWYCDNIALDSAYNYDPLWKRCVELGVAVTQHAGSPRWVDRASISNFTYNHIGHFANSNHAFARGVFLGGVVHRFPTLNFGYMEGGVSWACQMLADLTAHWEKRRKAGLQYPTQTDRAMMRELISRYGDERLKAQADGLMNNLDAFRPEHSLEELEDQEVWDDFEASGVTSKAQIRDAYSSNFYFGCEADDPATMWAFNPKMGARLRPIFSSDFTHFDVPDFAGVLPEAYELVEEGMVNEHDFKEFTFTNAARLHARNNPDFFKDTAVEREVAKELGLTTVAVA